MPTATITVAVRVAGTRDVIAALEEARRLIAPDRHTRAMAQARAAGITTVRDALTANA